MRRVCVVFATGVALWLAVRGVESAGLWLVLTDVPLPARTTAPPGLGHRGLLCLAGEPRWWLRRGAQEVAQQQHRRWRLRTLDGVLHELALGRWLSIHFDDAQLTRRLGDDASFGRGSVGLEAGARAWFGLPLERLSLGQLALLVGLAQSPSSLDPERRPDRALRRRDFVLGKWGACGLVRPGTASALRQQPLEGLVGLR